MSQSSSTQQQLQGVGLARVVHDDVQSYALDYHLSSNGAAAARDRECTLHGYRVPANTPHKHKHKHKVRSDDSDSNTGDTRWRGKLQTPKTKTSQTKSVYTDNVVPMDLSPDGGSSANKRPLDRS